MYIPLQTLGECFALGVFDTEEEAQDAYMEYLQSHEKFPEWFDKFKAEFNQLFKKSNLSIECIEDFKLKLFQEDLYDDLDFEQCELMEQFSEEHLIDMGGIIHELSDNYPQKYSDVVELAGHREFCCDKTFGNHCNNLLFATMYRGESVYSNCDTFIKEMVKLHPLF